MPPTNDGNAYALWRSNTALDVPFLVATLFTKSYQGKAERLAASLERHGLPHALFEVPSVHRSISSKGNDDIRYCKAHFLQWALPHFNRPILFIDSDCEVQQRPDLIWDLVKGQFDFAIYNWFADLMNDAWVPEPALLDVKAPNGAARFWRYSFSIDFFAANQLACSGCVQYWRNSDAAIHLLAAWERETLNLGTVVDDEVLDYTFNLKLPDKRGLRWFWLPKEYARYAWWIYTRPTINHPDLPITFQKEGHFVQMGGRRVDPAGLIEGQKARPFPRAVLVDTVDKLLVVRDTAGNVAPVAQIQMPLYT